MAFRSHFSISRHHMKHYFVHNVLLYCNKYLFIPTLYGNLQFHKYSIYTIPNTAGSESFTESHPILRKDKFTTNINLWQFSVLNRSINSTLTRFIIKLAYNNYQFLSFILSCFQDYYRVHLKSYQREPYQRNSLRKSFLQKISTVGSFLFFCIMNQKVYSLGNIFKNNDYFLPSINYSVRNCHTWNHTKEKPYPSAIFLTRLLLHPPSNLLLLQNPSNITGYYFKILQTYSFAPIFAYSLTMDYLIVHGLTLLPPRLAPGGGALT